MKKIKLTPESKVVITIASPVKNSFLIGLLTWVLSSVVINVFIRINGYLEQFDNMIIYWLVSFCVFVLTVVVAWVYYLIYRTYLKKKWKKIYKKCTKHKRFGRLSRESSYEFHYNLKELTDPADDPHVLACFLYYYTFYKK